ncbi:hypothetical protein ATO8_17945 [Roseivivax marinus]|jgi:hypothetical protein|uniref:Uncharacterized protein n=1 Tax=Roseivivax marinus TaxID=1379903 RepID=W4HEL6_9RHOB|nr:hypothetical protein ATO8_17945 [Roseivivax marinus]
MKASTYSDAYEVFILKQAEESVQVSDACGKLAVATPLNRAGDAVSVDAVSEL